MLVPSWVGRRGRMEWWWHDDQFVAGIKRPIPLLLLDNGLLSPSCARTSMLFHPRLSLLSFKLQLPAGPSSFTSCWILTVHQLTVVVDDPLDLTVPLKVLNGDTCERTVDLHSVDEDRLRDHLVGWHLLENSVVGWLVKDDEVLCLVKCEE